MRRNCFNVCVVLSLLFTLLLGSCSEPVVDNREQEYGYAQFKLYKEASYQPAAKSGEGSRAVQTMLDRLGEAHKIKVTLSFGETTIAQTLTLAAADDASAEFGLRSDKLKLLTGEYRLITFSLYDAMDEVIYNSTPDDVSSFTVVEGGLVVHDLTVSVQPRGSVRFTLRKDFSKFENNPALSQKAPSREYTFDEAKYVTLTVAQVMTSGSTTKPTTFSMIPTTFDLHLDEDDYQSDAFGYTTSSLAVDTLLTLEAGNYRITSYELYDNNKSLLEANRAPESDDFAVQDNQTTEADVKVLLRETDEYIKDYYALYNIWQSLGGEDWYYIGENFPDGANWDFNKDPDLWGDQPGVVLHSNGRVARIDISDFGFKGHLSPAIGQLSELIELYLGTHNDNNVFTYDPTLDSSLSLSERRRARLESHGELLHMLHPATQTTEPIARALKEKGVKIRAIELYDTQSENEILNMATGVQRVRLMDTNHGTLCNGLLSLPAEIGRLSRLEYLYIANSAIESIPDEVSQLSSLTDVEIYNCPNLTEFPMVLAQLSNLVALNISNNKQWSAQEIYDGLSALSTGPSKSAIQIFYCRQNSLEELPATFKDMERLTLLDLAYNRISTIHPLGKNVELMQLYLDNNLLTSLPKDAAGYFCGYSGLETFSMRNNLLEEVPDIFDASSGIVIKSIDFSSNRIKGFEGDKEGTYRGVNVETFTLANNPELKEYPLAIAKSNSLVSYIILRACGIERIPEGAFTYRNSPALSSLDLSYNKLTDLPREMHAANLPYLYGVELSFNSFNKFPFEPLDCSDLTVFAIRSQRDAEGNRCLKEWPQGIFNHKGLRGLYLGSNDLRRIDDNISTLIYYLDISDNPNIIFDASDICYAWMQGAYILIYDKTQNILGCDYMLE